MGGGQRPGPTSNFGGQQQYGQPAPAPAAPPPSMVPASTPPGGSTLFLTFNGQRYPVAKDQFIIGRGSKTSDLAIKDGNISRKHAAVIRRNGTYFIKDLGSTNGIDYKGMRIDNKRIDEGDVFHLCDYELRFTYKR
jgi:pSer/pThr/pTyr-binding forkhead associated (FHA) protein